MRPTEAATLADELAGAPIPVRDVLRRAIEIASAVNQLHRQGRVHGRIEPASFLVTSAGLELAAPAADAHPLGPYAAPEQWRGVTDARSDIFAVGAVLYAVATGWKAFAGDTEDELRAAILEKQPPSIPTLNQDSAAAQTFAALDRVVSSCLVKHPDRRRQRMQNVLVDLKLLAGSAGRAAAAAPAPPAAAPARFPARVIPPLQTEPKPLEPRSAQTVPQPVAPGAEAIPFRAACLPEPAETRPAPPRLPAVPEPAPLTVEPVMPRAAETEPMGPSPAAVGTPVAARFQQAEPQVPDTAALPFLAAGESAIAPEPAPAEPVEPAPPATVERRASEILSPVGFDRQAPDVMNPSERRAHASRIKIRLRASARQKRNWIRALKAAAILGLAAVLALAGMAAGAYLRKPHQLAGLRFALPAPEQASYLSSPAISPDGKLLAFSAVGPDKKRLLWIRPLNSLKAAPLAGSDDALAPFWSPDSQFLAFFAGTKLKKIAVSGGAPTVLCATDGLAGGAWSRTGVIVFGRSFYDGLYRVPANGGATQSLTRLDAGQGERAHLWPRFLPDGKHFLFYALRDQEEASGISIGSLDDNTTQRLITADSNALYAELGTSASAARDGYLLFARGSTLTAQMFDAGKLAFKGEPFTVAEDISYVKFINLLPISASDNGLLAYQSIDDPQRQLVWFDRDGRQVGALGEPGEYAQARISPDGTRVAVDRRADKSDTADIWIFNLDTNRSSPLTTEPTHEGAPVWSRDGNYVAYFSNPGGHFDLYRKGLGDSAKQEPLAASELDKFPNDFSPDGKYLLFGAFGVGTNQDIWVLPLQGDREPFAYLQTVSSEGYAQFSPNGKWVAYQSDESGRPEVYVAPFPRMEGKSQRWQISTGGGLPKWRADGKELYYIMGNGKMMAVTVGTSGAFTVSAPRMLFQTRALPRTWNLFDVTGDGRRFLVNTPLEWAGSQPITVIANWTEGFKK